MARHEEVDNVVPFPVATSTLEFAALWLARLEKGLSETDRVKLGEWLRESPDNGKALHELAAFWGDLDLIADHALPVSRMEQNTAGRSGRWKYAAIFVLAAFGLGTFAYIKQTTESPAATVAVQFEQTFETSVGERSTEQLPDGSTITLNTNTKVHVLYQAHDRIIDMERGEAHFAVAHDVDRPFGVRASGHIVQAVGTAFNVRIQDAGKVEVTVTNGVVQILEDDKDPGVESDAQVPRTWWKNSLIGTGLVPGQVALLGNQLPDVELVPEVRRLEPADIESKLAWQHGVLVFEGEPLQVVLDEFSRYTTTEFTLDNAELAEVRIGGYFNAGDIDGLLETLNESFQIEAERIADNQILLRPNN
ncbi:MAG: FecR domain-containing protein [Pseudomonadota bacterium]